VVVDAIILGQLWESGHQWWTSWMVMLMLAPVCPILTAVVCESSVMMFVCVCVVDGQYLVSYSVLVCVSFVCMFVCRVC